MCRRVIRGRIVPAVIPGIQVSITENKNSRTGAGNGDSNTVIAGDRYAAGIFLQILTEGIQLCI